MTNYAYNIIIILIIKYKYKGSKKKLEWKKEKGHHGKEE
jgi:hypothetical protein